MSHSTDSPKRKTSSRGCGVLLALTSLPDPYGLGDAGHSARRFLAFLHRAGQTNWQMLPPGPPGDAPSFSPYDSPSAFAGSPWLISPDDLLAERLVTPEEIRSGKIPPTDRVSYARSIHRRAALLKSAFSQFTKQRRDRLPDYRNFVSENEDWLRDWALYAALKTWFSGRPWAEWEPRIRSRQATSLNAASRLLADEIAYHVFVQYMFDRQWKALRKNADERNISLIGDLPMFVALDSADGWAERSLFHVNARGAAGQISGYPPDMFSADGQIWGHPQYRWPAHHREQFSWWTRRFARAFQLFDVVRIDHFLGFTRTWSIPAATGAASKGRWVPSAGDAILGNVCRELGDVRMIAEDLGRVTPADVALRQRYSIPPMRVLQFGFSDTEDAQEHLPHNFDRLCAAYTGTHDNDTILGWWKKLDGETRKRVLLYLGADRHSVAEAAVRTILTSPADLAIIPMQDLLGLGSHARMNTPGTVSGDWQWRMTALPSNRIADNLRRLTEISGRIR